MKLTSKGRYAVTAVLDIALNANDAPVSLADISERQSISLSYLEQLFAKLRRDGLVKSVRGPGGGYRLGLAPKDISVAMIIAAVNENVNVTRCYGNSNCKGGVECLTHTLWESLSERIENFLSEITLEELVQQRHAKNKMHQDFKDLVMVD